MQRTLKFLFVVIFLQNLCATAGAQSWKLITPIQGFGICAAFNPLSHGRTIFTTAGDLNIARSDDGGITWRFYQIPKKPDSNILIHQLLCLEADTNIVFALGDSVFRSTNGGKTWKGVLPVMSDDGETLVYHAASSTLYYSGSDMLAIWTSTDHGAHWSRSGKQKQGMLCTIAVSNDAQPTILAGSGGGIVRSIDQGLSWKTVIDGDSNETSKILYAKATPHTALATSWYSTSRTLMLTTDDGISWKDLHTDPVWVWTVEIDPDPLNVKDGIPQHFWIGLLPADSNSHPHPDISETFDGGITWKHYYLAAPYGHVWVWVLAYDSSSHRLLAATSDGLYALNTLAGVAGNSASSAPSAYPNPFTDRVNISRPSEFSGPIELQVWDDCGRMRYKSSSNGKTNTLEVETRNWHPGLYMLEMRSSSKVFREKLLRIE